MKLRLPVLLFVSIALTAAACPKKPERVDCQMACKNLAQILSRDRQTRDLSPYEGLDLETHRGRQNIERCVQDCLGEADKEQVECLGKAVSVETWLSCD